jgi:energy-coupling factor transporter ATP-binding protein EcfA2
MIEIKDPHHRYHDGAHALRGTALAISKGELLLICARNGSGKTTLNRLISGLLNPAPESVLGNGLTPWGEKS